MFDLVFCGSLLLHLQNPVLALSRIRSVTRGSAIIETTHHADLERLAGHLPAAQFGVRHAEESAGEPLGTRCGYWQVNRTGLQAMLLYAGFATADVGAPFGIPPLGHPAVVAHARP